MTPTPTPAAPTALQVHHSWLDILVKILAISAAVAPAAAAPFVDPATEKIIATESQLAGALAASEAQQ